MQPLGQRQDGGHFLWLVLPVPEPKTMENNGGQTPESQIVCAMPRCQFRSWTWSRTAASGTGTAPFSAGVLTPQHRGPAFVSTMSWGHGGFTVSPSRVPEEQEGDEWQQQRTILTELILTTFPMERQNKVLLGVCSPFLAPKTTPPAMMWLV